MAPIDRLFDLLVTCAKRQDPTSVPGAANVFLSPFEAAAGAVVSILRLTCYGSMVVALPLRAGIFHCKVGNCAVSRRIEKVRDGVRTQTMCANVAGGAWRFAGSILTMQAS